MLLPGFLLRGGNPVREGGVEQVQELQCAAEMRFLRSLSPHLNHFALPAAVLAVQDTDAEDCASLWKLRYIRRFRTFGKVRIRPPLQPRLMPDFALCPTAICIFRIKAATLHTCMWMAPPVHLPVHPQQSLVQAAPILGLTGYKVKQLNTIWFPARTSLHPPRWASLWLRLNQIKHSVVMAAVRNLMRGFTRAKKVKYFFTYRGNGRTKHFPHHLRRKMGAKISPPIRCQKTVPGRADFLRT